MLVWGAGVFRAASLCCPTKRLWKPAHAFACAALCRGNRGALGRRGMGRMRRLAIQAMQRPAERLLQHACARACDVAYRRNAASSCCSAGVFLCWCGSQCCRGCGCAGALACLRQQRSRLGQRGLWRRCRGAAGCVVQRSPGRGRLRRCQAGRRRRCASKPALARREAAALDGLPWQEGTLSEQHLWQGERRSRQSQGWARKRAQPCRLLQNVPDSAGFPACAPTLLWAICFFLSGTCALTEHQSMAA